MTNRSPLACQTAFPFPQPQLTRSLPFSPPTSASASRHKHQLVLAGRVAYLNYLGSLHSYRSFAGEVHGFQVERLLRLCARCAFSWSYARHRARSQARRTLLSSDVVSPPSAIHQRLSAIVSLVPFLRTFLRSSVSCFAHDSRTTFFVHPSSPISPSGSRRSREFSMAP